MIKEFNTYLKGIDTNFWFRFCLEEGILRKYKAGDYFIGRGEVGKYLGLIKKGAAKYVAYTPDMDEKIVGLETINGFVASWPFCFHGIPSPVSIIANSELEIYCVPISRIKDLSMTDKEVARQIAQANEQLFFTAYERLLSFYTQSPKARYEALLERCPTVFEFFDLKEIASFLNITPVHLSRLRKNRN